MIWFHRFNDWGAAVRRRLARLVTLLIAALALLGCTVQNPVVDPTVPPAPVGPASSAPAPAQPSSDNPCVVNGQVYCALNPDVTPDTDSLARTICKPGWTDTVRPSLGDVKRDQLTQGINLHGGDRNSAHYELDHRMPLELGGDTGANRTVTANLSLEWADAPTKGRPFHNHKDDDEDAFKRRVCPSRLKVREPLRQAQAEFVAKWLTAWPGYRS